MYGLTSALPLSNMGRLWSSTIWICRPSGVTSSRICERYSFRRGFCVMTASILLRSAWMRAASWRAMAARPISGFMRRCVSLSESERRTWPCTLVRSLPPPGITLELLPAPLPPAIDTCSGALK